MMKINFIINSIVSLNNTFYSNLIFHIIIRFEEIVE